MAKKQTQSTDSIYLSKLQFDPALIGNFMYRLINNPRLIFLIIFAIVIGGVYSFITLPRELNPEVEIPLVVVSTTLPGASPVNVEQLVTEPLENQIGSLTNIDSMTSQSRNSISMITVQFNSNVDPEAALNDVKERVDLVNNLPDEASTPIVQKLDFNEQPVWNVAITGDINRVALGNFAKELGNKIENAPLVRRVDLFGIYEDEVVINLQTESLVRYNLTPNQISGALQANNISFPAGSITINQLEYTVALNNEFSSIEAIRNLQLNLQGQVVSLGDIAEVYHSVKDTDTLVSFVDKEGNRQPAIELSIYKTNESAIVDAVNQAEDILDQEVTNHPYIEYRSILNFGESIDEQFSSLGRNFAETIALVFLILFLFLGLRQASIAALSIPLTFLSTFIIMNATGITLNFLSMFSLLLALGLVVDDAIVVVQAVSQYSRKFNPIETGLLVFRDFATPVWSTSLTTIWAFLPLVLATGIIGEFIRSIPIVVSTALFTSTLIAVLINIPLSSIFTDAVIPKRVKVSLYLLLLIIIGVVVFAFSSGSPLQPLAVTLYVLIVILFLLTRDSTVTSFARFTEAMNERYPRFSFRQTLFSSRTFVQTGLVNSAPVASRYKQIITLIIISRTKRLIVYTTVIGLILLSVVFAVSGLLPYEFFPKTDEDNLYISIEAPAGWTADKTEEVLQEVETRIQPVPEIETVFTTSGRSMSMFGDSQSGGNFGSIALTLIKSEDRERTSTEIADDLRSKVATISTANVTVEELSGGPPTGADFQVNIKGPDLEELASISEDFILILEQTGNAINIDSTLKDSPGEIQINLLPHQLAMRNLTVAEVGSWLRTALSGNEASSIRIDEDERDITLRIPDKNQSLEYLQNLPLPTQMGRYTLAEVSTITLESSPLSITREDEQRVVRVTASAHNISSQALLSQFNERVSDYKLPSGYSWDVGGANQENNRSVQSIIQAMLVAALLILITMVLEMNSFRKAVLILTVIPLAIIGIIINFSLIGIPLSFPALIGLLALFGIVVNNSIMLIEKINQNLHFRLSFVDAITDACASRVEPIFLTTLTTIAGLLSITLSDPLWRGLGGAIIAGLSVSGILILFVLPCLYYEVFKSSEEKKYRG